MESARGHPIFLFGNHMGGGFPAFNQIQQGFIHSFGPSTKYSWKHGANTKPSYSFSNGPQLKTSNISRWNFGSQPRLPFLAMLNLLDLSKLMKNLVFHNLNWSSVPTKLSSDIPKFEGNPGEYPDNHVTNFHLWFSSNSLNDDSVCLFVN